MQIFIPEECKCLDQFTYLTDGNNLLIDSIYLCNSYVCIYYIAFLKLIQCLRNVKSSAKKGN